jgi:hypothetical protein
MNKNETEIRKKEYENENKIKALTRKAEEAINYFKNIAIKGETRQGRFNDESRTTLVDDYKLRARSTHLEPSDMNLMQYKS